MQLVAAIIFLLGVAGCLATNDVDRYDARDALACSPDTRPRVLDEPTGAFVSSNYPSNYDDSADCRWLIVAQPGQVVSLVLDAFDTEAGDLDVLWIRDGNTATSVPIMGLDGKRQAPLEKIYSSGQNMFLQFTTDSSITATGFSASYTNVDPDTVEDACSGHRPLIIKQYNGTFASKFYPDLYPDGLACTILIESQEPGGFVNVDFTFFSTESNYDWVWLFDGDSSSAPMIARLSGSYTPAPTGFRSTNTTMFLQFVSDETVIAAGFTATYTSVPKALL